MSKSPQPPRQIRFGVFEFDCRTRELHKNGMKVKLHGQPAEVLAMLLERPGDLVTREELQRHLWLDDTVVEFDYGINAAVKRVREALGDSADNPRFVETLHRRGYRFIAPVESHHPLTPSSERRGTAFDSTLERREAGADSPPGSGGGQGVVEASAVGAHGMRPDGAATGTRRVPLQRSAALAAVALVAIVAALLALNVAGLRDRLFPRPASTIQSLAVLPLENLSGDKEQEYFADGMTDELITNLGQIRALRVISRSSVRRYKDKPTPAPQVAKELNVDAVVEGTVLRSAGRVRITAQLIDARNDRHLWAQSYERDLGDVLALQSEVARTIAREIRSTAAPGEPPLLVTPGTVNPTAYEAYLRARFFWQKAVAMNSREFMETSRRYLQEAIAIDPQFARAHAWLAGCYLNLAHSHAIPHDEGIQKARALLAKAKELDRNVGHFQLAWLKTDEDGDWMGAEREYERGVEVSPNDPIIRDNYAFHLLRMGRSEEAVSEAKRALQLDPVSEKINRDVAKLLNYARRYDEAIDGYRKLREINPDSMWAGGMAHAYAMKGMSAEAIAAGKEAVRIAPGDPGALHSLGLAYALGGRRKEALEVLSELKKNESAPAAVAEVYAALDEKAQAISWLEKAVDQAPTPFHFAWLRVEPVFDNLRDHPRFQALLRRMNFPP